ncbi:hypothetical protein [Streptomyces sp. NPDC086777]|uniref:hypothetical protein n=1 Tax=Streptomyces sp. NPDC086777 TaxID=3154866 RepID=UPI003450AB5F
MLTSSAHRSRPARTRRLLTGNARIFELGTPRTGPSAVRRPTGPVPRAARVGGSDAAGRAPGGAPLCGHLAV